MQRETMRIILIEDNPGDARLMQEMLEDAGGEDIDLINVPNLTEAFERIRAENFDLILLDLGLPESRGLETFRKVYEQHPDVPVVVLSGLDDEEVAISAVQEGAQDYLVKKQISGGALLRAVRYAIERHTARQREISELQRGGVSGTIALVGAKGGVGVTTTAINFGAALAVKGNSTIAVEMRGRYGTFSSMLGRTPVENISHIMGLGPEQITQEAVSSRLFRTPFGLRVLFGPQEARQEVDISTEQAAAIVDVTSEIAEYTILDIPSRPTEAGREAMRRSWRVFLVLEPEPASIRSAQVVLDELRTAGVTGQLMGALIVNRAAVPVGPDVDDVQESLGLEVYGVIPPAAEACAAAQRSGNPVTLAQPESVYSINMGEIADQLTARQITSQSPW